MPDKPADCVGVAVKDSSFGRESAWACRRLSIMSRGDTFRAVSVTGCWHPPHKRAIYGALGRSRTSDPRIRSSARESQILPSDQAFNARLGSFRRCIRRPAVASCRERLRIVSDSGSDIGGQSPDSSSGGPEVRGPTCFILEGAFTLTVSSNTSVAVAIDAWPAKHGFASPTGHDRTCIIQVRDFITR